MGPEAEGMGRVTFEYVSTAKNDRTKVVFIPFVRLFIAKHPEIFTQ